ncbi:STAS-like domain-containing protein [Sporosarcina contaminans]|uniref:STAS-like domain-containing protein n=1 Tax=Sporosarcina contaminans TaxID=633403 RepID=A0ABW3U4I9_9BACL
MVINVLDHVERCYSNEDGKVILDVLKRALKSGETVVLSFKGVNSLTSSFTNTALIELMNTFGFEYIKNHLRFINTNKHINEMIRQRFEFESKRIVNEKLLATV